MYYIGIDVAKTNHVASIVDSQGDIILRTIKFTNSKEGYAKLLADIQTAIGSFDDFVFAMEATGHYWLALFSALIDNDFNVSVFNPYQIKSYHTDYLRVFGTNDSSLPKEELLSLKQLTRFRSNVVEIISTLKTQVIGILDKVFPEYKAIFSDTFGVTSKQLLLNFLS